MAEKLYEYEGFLGFFHRLKASIKETCENWKEQHNSRKTDELREAESQTRDYGHIYRRKTRAELIRISAAVMGIEFSYAAETAFVSPTLLKIGVEHKHMTLVWALSPLIGFFLTPVLGSLSDRCQLPFGRRRPFIMLLSFGVLVGLLLVPNGEDLGYLAGDINEDQNTSSLIYLAHRTTANSNSSLELQLAETTNQSSYHPWGIVFTILGTVLLDFDADACQSPARAYLLDVTVTEDHARGLSTFTIMAGLGGFFGYATGGINWDATFIGTLLGGQVRAVFTLITIVFVICVVFTITSFKEIPLELLETYDNYEFGKILSRKSSQNEQSTIVVGHTDTTYGAVDSISEENNCQNEDCDINQSHSISAPANASLRMYLKSIIFMPYSLKILCLTNLFCWMAHVCYSLYFTDFVGEAVFNGDPKASKGSLERQLYEEGIRFGCWGMSMYSLSCACYSSIIERLINRFGARTVYVGGLLVYSTGMLFMTLAKEKISVIVFSWTAGVMYSTLFTMPYLLVAHYHAKGTFELTNDGQPKPAQSIRGLGTDVAVVSSMVFLAQFILSMCMGSIVSIVGSTAAVVGVASVLAFLGAISATQVMYLDL